ncbi:MAG: 16S rRNA (uracil(1498)-N(3))-methyltransferase [Alphaproteobacteria bacterium]|nr:16S rRNA (uracil(1498)-N(3))-methyltransferase [Alphaproteobacteria bacterium]
MIRLFVDQHLSKGMSVALTEKTAHYLIHVMRCPNNAEILCFNGKDGEWSALLEIKNKKQLSLNLIKQTRAQTHPHPCVLCPALIKKDNMDLVLQKATELGVTDIYPLITEHTVHTHFNQTHAEAIVREAAEQCERLDVPTIHPTDKVSTIYQKLCKDYTCCCLSERICADNRLSPEATVAFFVGPEGGWSKKEMDFFQKNDCVLCHFDVGILRAETAGIGILAAWQLGKTLYLKK